MSDDINMSVINFSHFTLRRNRENTNYLTLPLNRTPPLRDLDALTSPTAGREGSRYHFELESTHNKERRDPGPNDRGWKDSRARRQIAYRRYNISGHAQITEFWKRISVGAVCSRRRRRTDKKPGGFWVCSRDELRGEKSTLTLFQCLRYTEKDCSSNLKFVQLR